MGLSSRKVLTHKSCAFVFPGQGSQQVGMLNQSAEKYPIIKETFNESSEVLGLDLWALVNGGPEATLNETVNTQPALLAAGVALWRAWQLQGGPLPMMLAGHSLGEYTALVCANAISLKDGIKLVAERGKFMQEAVPQGVGAMAAILGLDDQVIQALCQEAAEGEVVAPANYNSIGQTVIAGHTAAVARACALAKLKGAKRAIPLPVSVPSHCDLMRPAAMKLGEQLSQIPISSPLIPIIHNVDVEMCSHPDDIRERLVKQLYCPVRWVETIQRLANEGMEWIAECGPGKVLTGLIKRIDPSLKPMGIEIPSEFDVALENLR